MAHISPQDDPVQQEDQGVVEGWRPENFRHYTSKKYAKLRIFLGVHGSGQNWGINFYKNETIDKDEYQMMLTVRFSPSLEEYQGGTMDGKYWQQDGANVHNSKKVLKYPDGMFTLYSVQGDCLVNISTHSGFSYRVYFSPYDSQNLLEWKGGASFVKELRDGSYCSHWSQRFKVLRILQEAWL
jgi:hypothetical protein